MSNPFVDVPPPLPPKQAAAPRRQQQQQQQQQQQPHQSTRPNPRTDPSHTHHHSRSTDPPSRSRPSRSQTALPPSSNTRPQPTPARRSHSSDSVPSDKTKPQRSKTKKGSTHADVIDRLDFTGVGPMFHHDGPFDACAPSRNKHRTKAPMYAWTAINPEDEEVAARYRDKEDGMNPVTPTLTYDAYTSEIPRSPPVDPNYASYYPEAPKKKVDAIAEAWGIHEPEPYEEFFAGGGDHDGPITNGNPTTREARSNGRRTREDLTSRPRVSHRSNIPPPQPIFVPGPPPELESYTPQSSPNIGGANIGRNNSIMRRIRKMRDSPNVPVGIDEATGAPSDGAPSPTSSTESGGHGRPAHRPRDSLLGRFARRGDSSPTTPVDPYGYIGGGGKDLPATPASPSGDAYFDRGLGRKTSILKRVKGAVVRGSK